MSKQQTLFILLLCCPLYLFANDIPRLKASADALGAYTGNNRWLIVKLWASDCAVCNRSASAYVDFHNFHKDTDASMLGITLDGGDQGAAHSYMESHAISFPNLITDYQTGSQWYESLTGEPFRGTPSFLVFDPQGKLRAKQAGAVPVELIEQFIATNSQE